MNTPDQFKRVLNFVVLTLDLQRLHDGKKMPWFIAYGALLKLIRDGKRYQELLQKNPNDPAVAKFLEDDFDVSMEFGRADAKAIISGMKRWGFIVNQTIVHNFSLEPFFVSFVPDKGTDLGDMHIDFFFQVRANGYMWHTYDVLHERPTRGIPSKYIFKGVKEGLFGGQTWRVQWPGTVKEVNCPEHFGGLLDVWYNDISRDAAWFLPNSYPPTSLCHAQVEIPNCANLGKALRKR